MADGWDMEPGQGVGATVPNRTCYAYVDVTHEYVCPVVADIDPLEPENVLWPRNSTQVIPPAFTAGKTIPVFDEKTQKWAVLPDFRGKFGYTENGTPVQITKAGNPSTFDPPLSPNPPAPEPIPVDPNISSRTSKVEFWRRATDDEATAFLADLTDASPRLRALFDAVTYLTPGTPEYPALRAAIVARVGEERADELLAPSND